MFSFFKSKKDINYYIEKMDLIIKEEYSKISPYLKSLNVNFDSEVLNERKVNLSLGDQYSYLIRMQNYNNEVFSKLNNYYLQLSSRDEIHSLIFHRLNLEMLKYGLTKEILKKANAVGDFSHIKSQLTVPVITKELKRVETGLFGENKFKKELEKYKKIHDFIYLEGQSFKYKDNKFETDFLLFDSKGIFSIEVKNIFENSTGKIIIQKDGQWLFSNKNGETKVIHNATNQNIYHVSLTNKILSEYNNSKIKEPLKCKGVIVIANENVVIENNSDYPVFRIDKFFEYLNTLSESLTTRELKDLSDFFLGYKVKSKEYPLVLPYNPEAAKNQINDLLFLRDNVDYFNRMSNEIINRIQKDNELLKFLSKDDSFEKYLDSLI